MGNSLSLSFRHGIFKKILKKKKNSFFAFHCHFSWFVNLRMARRMELSVRRCIYPASHLAVGGNWQPARYLVCVCFYLTGKVARCRVTLNFLLCHSSVPLRNLNVPVHLLLSPSHCTPHVFLIRTWDGRQRHILSWPAPNSCFLFCFFFICKLGSYVLFFFFFFLLRPLLPKGAWTLHRTTWWDARPVCCVYRPKRNVERTQSIVLHSSVSHLLSPSVVKIALKNSGRSSPR